MTRCRCTGASNRLCVTSWPKLQSDMKPPYTDRHCMACIQITLVHTRRLLPKPTVLQHMQPAQCSWGPSLLRHRRRACSGSHHVKHSQDSTPLQPPPHIVCWCAVTSFVAAEQQLTITHWGYSNHPGNPTSTTSACKATGLPGVRCSSEPHAQQAESCRHCCRAQRSHKGQPRPVVARPCMAV